MSNSLQPCNAPLSTGSSRQEYWSGLPSVQQNFLFRVAYDLPSKPSGKYSLLYSKYEKRKEIILNYIRISEDSSKCQKMEKRMQVITKNSSQTGEAGFRHLVLILSPQCLTFLSSLSGNWDEQLVVEQKLSGKVRGDCGGLAGGFPYRGPSVVSS